AWPRRRELWVLHAMLLAYAASVVMFYVFARYRYPIVPLLVLFAAAGVTDAGSFVAQGYSAAIAALKGCATFWPTFAAVSVAAVLANWPILSTDLMRAVTENNLAVALQAAQRLDEAKTHYERAIALRSDYAAAYR